MQIEQIGITLRAAFARRRVYNKVVDELSAYTDRELGELGLSRHDIHTVARQAAEEANVSAPAVTLHHDWRFARTA